MVTQSLLHVQAVVDAEKPAASPKNASDCEVLVMIGLPGMYCDRSFLPMQPYAMSTIKNEQQ